MKLIWCHNSTSETKLYGFDMYYDELYDLGDDIRKENNLIHDKTYKKLKNKMIGQLTRTRPCSKDCRRFKLKMGPEKGIINLCSFFINDLARCHNDHYLEGTTMCNSVCGRHKQF